MSSELCAAGFFLDNRGVGVSLWFKLDCVLVALGRGRVEGEGWGSGAVFN